ncbi:TMV resistance protein N [Cryptomeria japonica]|uniref:TMV resistance protein N n=1 Tax=Cryptomeria japonica TaxID=3369 RepID=UPI0027D9F0CB|nr:TMV resistance protein N [Cryptomeria japonica]
MGFHVFLDLGALEAGNSIPAELQHAIATATLHFAIFAPNCSQTPWCLTELSSMFKSGAKVILISDHVDPSHLRCIEQGKGIYAPSFAELEKKGRYTQEKLHVWKTALCDSSFIPGYMVNNNMDEATILKNIVNCSLQIMKKVPLWVAEHLLGLNELVQGFVSVAREEEVKITGFMGMGGIGKSTFVKELLIWHMQFRFKCARCSIQKFCL